MKKVTLVLSIWILMFACSLTSAKNDLIHFIPGTYTSHSTSEFGTSHDTLVIVLQNEGAGEYKIIRHSRYDRVLDGKKMAPRYEQAVTIAVLDKEQERLLESATGDTYSFDRNKNVLFNGPIKYEKR